ncbi:MAG TPA: flagellin [Bryobacteraceae bacterium]|nr:flagellin [Bryobacteraceae bacterium]
MSISIQTNVTSLIAQQNLNVNTANEGTTITQLTSGFRINSSGDDAAGLAVANQYNADISQLTQGVQNANNGVSTLQIIDGGLGNISQILNRLETLATESASGTFSGNRATLDQEFQAQLGEITRQADNIGLNSGGNFNNSLSVFIGGARLSTVSSSGQVNVDLSTTSNAVDAASLGLTGANVLGGTTGGVEAGIGTGGRLDNPGSNFLTGATQTYTFNYVDSNGNSQTRSVVLNGGTSGINGTTVLANLNNGLAGTGITASVNATNGDVQFTSSGAFSADVAAPSVLGASTAATGSIVNTSEYNVQSLANFTVAGPPNKLAHADTFTISEGTNSANVTLATTDTVASSVNKINTALQAAGITNVAAVAYNNGTQVSIQGTSNFSVVDTGSASGVAQATSFFGTGGVQAVTAGTVTSGTAGTNATAALAAINKAIAQLGTVQGAVGAGENKLRYSIALAQSQIASFSNAESSIKDVDVAAAASNLSKEQILQQSSVAALVQANAIPQAVLTLLKSA